MKIVVTDSVRPLDGGSCAPVLTVWTQIGDEVERFMTKLSYLVADALEMLKSFIHIYFYVSVPCSVMIWWHEYVAASGCWIPDVNGLARSFYLSWFIYAILIVTGQEKQLYLKVRVPFENEFISMNKAFFFRRLDSQFPFSLYKNDFLFFW